MEVRALLDLMRENRAAMQDMYARCQLILSEASAHLTALDPGLGDTELIESVAVELAQLLRR